MRTNKLIMAITLCLIATATQAQSLWTSAGMDFKVAKNLNGYVEGEYRTGDKLSGTDRWTLGLGLDYKLCPYIKIGASYKFIDRYKDSRTTKKGNIIDSYWQPRHRLSFDVTGNYKFGRLRLSLRERYQYTHQTEQTVAKYDGDDGSQKDDELIEAKDKHTLRSRLKAEYNIRKSALTPFASIEIYNSLNNGFASEKLRYTLGTDISLSKRHTLSVFYRYVDSRDDDDDDMSVIGIGYKFSL